MHILIVIAQIGKHVHRVFSVHRFFHRENVLCRALWLRCQFSMNATHAMSHILGGYIDEI